MPKLTIRSLLAICLATGAWSFSLGVGTQVTSLSLKELLAGREDKDRIIGLVQSTTYLGLALGALAVPWLTKRMRGSCASVGMIASGATLILLAHGGGLASWFILRLLNGVAGGMSLVPLETRVSHESPQEQRARTFSFYAVALTLGGALGIWAGLHYYAAGDALPFYLGGLLPVAGGVVLLGTLPDASSDTLAEAAQPVTDWPRDFLCYGTAWFQGFLESGMLAFLSLYLIAMGMSQNAAGELMGSTMIGVILFQVPIAGLADRLGRMPMLLGCYAVVAACLGLVPARSESLWLATCLFLLGACAGALYPLALALLGDRPTEGGLTRAYAVFMAMECVGSVVGAAAMGEARYRWGEASMFAVGLAALALVLGSWTVLVLLRSWHAKAKSD